jgi:hypothetical protein
VVNKAVCVKSERGADCKPSKTYFNMKQQEYTPELVKVPQAARLMDYSDRPSFKRAYTALGGKIIEVTRKTHYVDMHDVRRRFALSQIQEEAQADANARVEAEARQLESLSQLVLNVA